MKTKLLRFLMLMLVGAGMSSVNAQEVIYSWESPDGTVIETGGTASYKSGPADENRVNYKNADYYTLCVNGKKDKMGKEESSNGGYIQIDLDEALQAGDIISITAYINKDASGKEASLYFKFENGEGVDDPYILGDADNIHDVVKGTINTHTFTVPASADGSKFFQMSRNKSSTNIFITKLVINKGEGGPVVSIAMPTFEVDGVAYESGATVEGLKTGHHVTVKAEEGRYIYSNWSSKTGNSKDSYYVAKNMKGQTSIQTTTSSGGQRVLYALAADTDNPEDVDGHTSDLAYIIFSGVTAADPVFTPAAGEVEVGTVVKLATEASGDLIYYTTDGSDPTAESTAYDKDAGITINENVTIKAIAFDKNNENGSAIVTAAYTVPAVVIPTPVITPASGATVKYGDAITISYDEAYILKYTTDGSDPKESATAMSGTSQPQSITVDQEGTFTVKAYLSNDEGASDVVTATYTVEGGPIVVGAPTFDPAPGAVEKGTKVTIKLGENAQSIVFTTDGTDPRLNGDQVPRDWTVVINEETTIKAYCQAQVGDKAFNSEVVEATYTIKEATPSPEFALTFDPKDGTNVEVNDEITLTYDDEAFLLYYTTDGSDPKGIEGEVYSAWGTGEKVKVTGEGNFVIKAYLEDRKTNEQSEVYVATYPILAPVVAQVTFDPESGTEVEVDDEITLTYDDEAFLLYYTTDGSDPKGIEGEVYSAWGTGEKVKVAGEGNFVIKAYLENRKTNEQSEVFVATYPIKAAVIAQVTFNPESGTEVEVDDEITIDFDGDNFQCWVTTDGSDPATSLTAANIFPGEAVKVAGEGEFVVKAVLENNKTSEQTLFTATYPIKAAVVAQVTFDPESGTEVEVEDEITIDFDGDNFQCWVTTDGSDPATSLTAMNLFPGEAVKVAGEGEFVVKAMLENNKTSEQTYFTAIYPIKGAAPGTVAIATRANGYGTYCSDKDLDFSACDAQAFIARLNGNKVILTEVQEVPAGTGILVKFDGEEAIVPIIEEAAPITAQNDFIGTLEDTEVAYGTVSILSVVDGEEGFYKFLGTVIPANKAYFNKVATGSANAKLSFVFDEADGINAIVADAIESGDAYNLNGQRVKKSYKGVVIVNGKKYFKK